jgi:CheY-like chemotaxis protein
MRLTAGVPHRKIVQVSTWNKGQGLFPRTIKLGPAPGSRNLNTNRHFCSRGAFSTRNGPATGVFERDKVAKAKILVVDDELQILQVVASILDRAGYETTTVPEPRRALEIIVATGGFDLVLSDVVMPEMRGPELAERIRRLSPSSPVMLMSGCVAASQLPRGIPFLGKPFSSSDLTRAVSKVLKKSSRGLTPPPPVAFSAGCKGE